VARPFQKFCRRALLHDAPGVHDGDTVSDLRHDREVMGDVDDGHACFGAQALHLGEDHRLGDHVQAGRWLIHDQDRGLADERDRDREPLLLAAGQLMGEPAPERRFGTWSAASATADPP
jgi:hypothetical protein